jgi:hypothetical protein
VAVQGEFTALGLQHGTTRFLLPTCRWPQSGKLPPRPEAESYRGTLVHPSHALGVKLASREASNRTVESIWRFTGTSGERGGARPVASPVSSWQLRGYLEYISGCAHFNLYCEGWASKFPLLLAGRFVLSRKIQAAGALGSRGRDPRPSGFFLSFLLLVGHAGIVSCMAVQGRVEVFR